MGEHWGEGKREERGAAIKLLELIGSGFIRYKLEDNACVLVVSPVTGLKKVVHLINGELRTPAW